MLDQFAQERLARVREKMAREGLSALFVRGVSNQWWLSNFKGVFDEEVAHAFLITQSVALIHTDSRYETAFREQESSLFEISAQRLNHFDWVCNCLEDHFASTDEIRLGIETTISLDEFRTYESKLATREISVELVETTRFIEQLREVKDESELACMRRAQAITDEAFSLLIDQLEEGMTEKQVQHTLDDLLYACGAEGLAFPTIVATGAHGASPHAQPGDTPLASGDAVVMDFGARYQGYCSDMTRTVFVGEPQGDLLAAWQALRLANETCEQLLTAEKTGAEVHEAAESVLAEHGFDGCMGHGLGHSLGLDIHESPSLSPVNTQPIPAGATVTVEPGIYIPGKFGMRLEDFGVVTPDGFQVFTQSTHELVIIKRH